MIIRKELIIRRQQKKDAAPYWESFFFETEEVGATVATALTELVREHSIGWECSCLQKKCGACAMVINGVPRLACDTKLVDCKTDAIRLEPLKKFPVVRDLIVDRSAMMERLKELSVWLETDGGSSEKLVERKSEDVGEGKAGRLRLRKESESADEIAYEASKCLQCGLCLEICPNFAVGAAFSGMAAMSPMTRLIVSAPKEQRKQLARDYEKSVYAGCGKSLACREVCPAGINIDRLMSRSNAAAIWGRWN